MNRSQYRRELEDLAFFGGKATIEPKLASFDWPVVDNRVRLAVLNQLNDSISIYDRSSVFAEFEERFAFYHESEFAILYNSGSSAIYAMFDAIGIGPADEVLCSAYNFHAAISPIVGLGGRPVFCDCDDDGNVPIEEIKKRTSRNTKAVLVTHMWGVPAADIGPIGDFCKARGIYLLEDCSHAHGARSDGRIVGTFGDMACWSLQGQKVVSGGEGGILVTNNRDLYERAVLVGHYNQRAKAEIRETSSLHKFASSGKGYKLRAHPLGIAVALDQFGRLENILSIKNRLAAMYDAGFLDFDFIYRRSRENCAYSWYVYPFHYNENLTRGVTRRDFVDLLHAEGLVEFDVPGSTGSIHKYPIFTHPHELFPNIHKGALVQQGPFHVARKVARRLIKVPVWATDEDKEVVEAYVEGFRKVAKCIENHPEISERMRARRQELAEG